jgi:hypothetical protein
MSMLIYPTEASCREECGVTPTSSACFVEWQKSPTKTFTDLDVFHDYVLLKVANVPTNLIDNAIVNSAIKFGERTKAIRRWIYMDLQKDVNEYNITLSGAERINAVHRVWVDGVCLPIGEQECTNGCCDLDFNQSFWFKAPDTIMVKTMAPCDKKRAIRFEVSVVPTRAACQIDTEYFERYLDGVVAGAVAELRMSDKSYGYQDINLSKAAQQQFGFAVNEANNKLSEAKHGTVRRIMGGMG